MTAKELKRDITCQCEHCKEIIRQQDRMEKLQYLKTKPYLNPTVIAS